MVSAFLLSQSEFLRQDFVPRFRAKTRTSQKFPLPAHNRLQESTTYNKPKVVHTNPVATSQESSYRHKVFALQPSATMENEKGEIVDL